MFTNFIKASFLKNFIRISNSVVLKTLAMIDSVSETKDHHSLLLLSGAGFAAATAFGAYRYIRPRLFVTVNCWFCSNNSRVKYAEKNCWTCLSCGQYNGFTAEGDYNRLIPEQYVDHDSLNEQIQMKQNKDNAEFLESNNGLCHTCNFNQELKIHQLKKFVPSKPDYDSEIEDFQQLLERTYRLCRNCEAVLHQKLGEQDSKLKSKLLAWKLDLNLRKSLTADHSAETVDVLQCWVGLIISLMFGVFVASQYVMDSNFLSYQHVVTSSIVAVMSLYSINPWVVITFRRHKFFVATWIAAFFHSSLEDSLPLDPIPHFRAAVAATALLTSLTCWRSRKWKVIKPKKSKMVFKDSSLPIRDDTLDEETFTQDLLSSTSSTPRASPAPETVELIPGHEVHDGVVDNSSEDDACDISVLHIDKIPSARSGRSPPFEIKIYHATPASMNFGSNSILRPPKFVYNSSPTSCPPAASSLVRRGLFQRDSMFGNTGEGLGKNHSRTSSQTSGFVSETNEKLVPNFFRAGSHLDNLYSSLPNSRANSFCGDKNSVLSEPAFRHQINLDSTKRHDLSLQYFRGTDVKDSDSLDSSLDRFTLPNPRSHSSPKLSPSQVNDSILDKKIQISISVYSLLFVSSLALNLGVFAYLLFYC